MATQCINVKRTNRFRLKFSFMKSIHHTIQQPHLNYERFIVNQLNENKKESIYWLFCKIFCVHISEAQWVTETIKKSGTTIIGITILILFFAFSICLCLEVSEQIIADIQANHAIDVWLKKYDETYFMCIYFKDSKYFT